MSEAPYFSVIIVNYNGGDYLQKAIRSLEAQTVSDFEVWVVDNNSTDGSLDTLDMSRLSAAQLIRMGRNSGFAEGNNVAARRANGKWIALLNCDAVAAPDWLETLKRYIETYPDVAMFACSQVRMDEPHLLDGVGDCFAAFGFAWRGGYLWPVETMPDFGSVFAPCGASAVYRTDVFLEQDGFDESYFCFVEDVDLAFRLRLAGEKCLFLPDARVIHKGGALSGETSDFSVYQGTRNRIWAYVGNMPTALFVLTMPFHFVLTIYLIIRYLGQPNGKAMRSGLRDGWATAPHVRRKRKENRIARKVSLWQLSKAFTWNIFKMSQRAPDVRRYP